MALPQFKGKVVKRDDEDYEATAYQYATSSNLEEGIMRPAAIIMAADDSDVIAAINYARCNNLAVAVRTGGHQYSGASSTCGNNIQLDLSKTYTDFTWEDGDHTVLTLGISIRLHDFNAKLKEKCRFVPHGQCQYVHLGGHVQTGGYGQLARSFGLLADTVQKFRIITADGNPRWVCRGVEQDKDLFFAVLGGSPGNFGVLTHVTLHVFRDEDHPKSRGIRAAYPYKRERLKRLLDVMVDMAEDDDFPADFDYCVTVMDESLFDWAFGAFHVGYDRQYCPKSDTLVKWPPLIVVFAQWANLGGAKQEYDPAFFDKIKKAGGLGFVQIDDDKHVPISTMTGHWTVAIRREYELPFIKRTFASNSCSKRLKDLKWTDWVSDRIDELGGPLFFQHGCSLSTQLQHFGGSKSKLFQNGKNSPTSYSWRDTRLGATMDVFYHHRGHKFAEKWQQGNDEGVGRPDAPFCEGDHRILWGSHDKDLSANHKYYYDDQPAGKYQRLCDIKKKYDPTGVFTPNRFCIGLSEDGAPAASTGGTQSGGFFAGLQAAKDEVVATLASAKDEVAAKFASLKPEKEEEAAETEQEEGSGGPLSMEDKFWKMVKSKREEGKAVPMWDLWQA